jgi:uncharacterized coiled-coil protein SlyX
MTDITDRISELESQLAHIENMQEELSAVVADHGKIIDQLRKPSENVPPPHY